MRTTHCKTYYFYFLICTLLIITQAVISCRPNNKPAGTLLRAEQLMNERPDSALLLLEDSIDTSNLSAKDYADWCLLLTQARDKNYVEHSSDSLIRVALKYYENQDDPERLMLTWYYMGRVTQDMHDAIRAQEHYLKALEAGKLSNDLALKARICSNLGMLYTYQDAFDMALVYMKEGLEYLQQVGDTLSQSVVLTDIGRTFWTTNRLDSAEYYYQKALMHASIHQRPLILGELGGLYIDSKQYDRSLPHLQASLQSKTNFIDTLATYLSLGKLYLLTNKLDSAQLFLQKSLESPVLYTKAGASHFLYQVGKLRKDWNLYISMHEQYESLRDSIQQQTYTETLQRMQSLHNYQLVENETRQHQLNLEISRKNNYLLALLSILLAVCLTGYFFYMQVYVRTRKKLWNMQENILRQVIKVQQCESEDKISANMKQIKELDIEVTSALDTQKKLIEQKKELLKLENLQIKQDKKVRLVREEFLKSSPLYIKFHTSQPYIPKAQEKEELINAIDTTYPHFMATIMQLYPGIMDHEKEVCYYTKIGLMNKQISDRLSCGENTVTMKKIRLYKKIHQKEGNTESFNKFIRSL